MSVNNGGGSEEDHPSQQQKDEHINKRPVLPKYATTTHGEKKFSSVLIGEFDKNLTIEKARFDSGSSSHNLIPHPPVSTSSTPSISLPTNNTEQTKDDTINATLKDNNTLQTKSPPLSTSVTLPTVTTLQSMSGPGNSSTTSIINTIPSQSTPLTTKIAKPKVEDRRTIKRKKLPPMSGTATPSEVFHRNLVDAVSNVEDSDENEQYVYPYSGNNTDTTTTYHMNPTDTIHRTTSSSLYRPHSTRSFINNNQPTSQQSEYVDYASTKRTASSGFLADLLRPILFKSKSDSKAILKQQQQVRNEEQLARPKLRNYVMDHPFSQSKLFNNEVFDGKHSPPLHHHQGGSNSRRHPTAAGRRMYSNYGIGDGGYTTDDEEAQHLLAPPLSSRRSQQSQNRHRKQSSACSRFLKYLLTILLAFAILLFLLITYLAKPLKGLQVEMGRVLSTDKELIFDLHIQAINSNFWTVHIADADISVFAFSQVVPVNAIGEKRPDIRGVDPAEYLGGFYHFDEPLSFRSSFNTKQPVTAVSQIRIKSPGADKSGNERWSRIIRYPYGLVVRGVLKYKTMSFLSPYPQSIAICDVVRVDPTTDKVSEDPDQGFCLSYNGNDSVVTTAAAIVDYDHQTTISHL